MRARCPKCGEVLHTIQWNEKGEMVCPNPDCSHVIKGDAKLES